MAMITPFQNLSALIIEVDNILLPNFEGKVDLPHKPIAEPVILSELACFELKTELRVADLF
ncbi:MAG: hypothetical protein LBR11_10725, partial [Deltaproteobacteria bacterium]|nr:hypothetical protein [Deltaproteobacteria bacterium]